MFKTGNTIMMSTISQKSKSLHFPTFSENQAQIYHPGFYTFTSKMDFAEDKTRHVYPLLLMILNCLGYHLQCYSSSYELRSYPSFITVSFLFKNQTQPSRLFIRSVLSNCQHFPKRSSS
ncbi:hypothetical protein M0811_12677 [Anaeramoeba ignava]|uniref:Uncharacterized protein n=1 Tax=Anaeramoeba ignava TaxID=1746090 RepID=A0A9Q0R5D4_ANAIG|nr:hypothetical protein M0811_12677 [Anaeramoeba ignava]